MAATPRLSAAAVRRGAPTRTHTRAAARARRRTRRSSRTRYTRTAGGILLRVS